MVAVPQSVSDHARVYSCVLLLSHNAPPPPHSLLVAGHGLFVARRRDGAVVIRRYRLTDCLTALAAPVKGDGKGLQADTDGRTDGYSKLRMT